MDEVEKKKTKSFLSTLPQEDRIEAIDETEVDGKCITTVTVLDRKKDTRKYNLILSTVVQRFFEKSFVKPASELVQALKKHKESSKVYVSQHH